MINFTSKLNLKVLMHDINSFIGFIRIGLIINNEYNYKFISGKYNIFILIQKRRIICQAYIMEDFPPHPEYFK